ncbi:MAG: HAD hydrolase family protein [Ruminococcus sp.]|nr:HAD hydrolase family protein [Ruminococcus sp.]
MKKIMFFDIDGTLVPEDGDRRVPESTVRAIEKAHRAGNLLYVNTGRPRVNVDDDLRELGFDGYVYGCGTELECEGQQIYYRTVGRELCLKTVELLHSCGGVPMFERRDGVFFDFHCRQLPVVEDIRQGFAALGKNVDRSTDDEDFSFDKFIVCFDGKTDIGRLRRELEKDFFWIDRGSLFAEIVPRPCSKATGIAKVLEHYGLDRSQAYAVGDSLNDLPMFDAVGTSIAMGNGTMLIPYADYVTDDIHKGGIYSALEHFGFF